MSKANGLSSPFFSLPLSHSLFLTPSISRTLSSLSRSFIFPQISFAISFEKRTTSSAHRDPSPGTRYLFHTHTHIHIHRLTRTHRHTDAHTHVQEHTLTIFSLSLSSLTHSLSSQNNLEELWSIIRFLLPSLFSSPQDIVDECERERKNDEK